MHFNKNLQYHGVILRVLGSRWVLWVRQVDRGGHRYTGEVNALQSCVHCHAASQEGW